MTWNALAQEGLIIDIRRIGAGDPLEFEVVSSVKEEAKQLIVCDGYARQRMDILDHSLDALLRWPVPQVRLSGSR